MQHVVCVYTLYIIMYIRKYQLFVFVKGPFWEAFSKEFNTETGPKQLEGQNISGIHTKAFQDAGLPLGQASKSSEAFTGVGVGSKSQ